MRTADTFPNTKIKSKKFVAKKRKRREVNADIANLYTYNFISKEQSMQYDTSTYAAL